MSLIFGSLGLMGLIFIQDVPVAQIGVMIMEEMIVHAQVRQFLIKNVQVLEMEKFVLKMETVFVGNANVKLDTQENIAKRTPKNHYVKN